MVSGFLVLRGSTYHFRRRVPADLKKYFPKRFFEISRSLGTSSKVIATAASREWAVKTERVFQFLRSGTPDAMKLEYLKSELSISGTLNLAVAPAVSVTPDSVPVPEKPKSSEKLISNLIDAYISSKMGAGDWQLKTRQETEFAIRLFIDCMGDMPLRKLNYTVIEAFRDKVSQIPANHTRLRRYKFLSIPELLAMSATEKVLPEPKTINKRLGFFSTMLDYAVQKDLMIKNPALGVRIKELGVSLPSDQRPAYTVNDIQDIVYRLSYDVDNPARFFVPLLAIFCGGRRREMCQLYVSDVRDIDGYPCLDINGLGDIVAHMPRWGKHKGELQHIPEKHLKYPASWRQIPVHPLLWNELGFGGYVEMCRSSGQKKLFPDLGVHRDGPGTSFSKWFDAEIAPWVCGDTEPKKSFHSFRHSIQTWYKHNQLIDLERGFANEILKEVIGHAYHQDGTEDLSKERYGKKYPMELCAKLLFQLDFGINFDCIREQVGELNSKLGIAEIKKSRNANIEYPREDNRER